VRELGGGCGEEGGGGGFSGHVEEERGGVVFRGSGFEDFGDGGGDGVVVRDVGGVDGYGDGAGEGGEGGGGFLEVGKVTCDEGDVGEGFGMEGAMFCDGEAYTRASAGYNDVMRFDGWVPLLFLFFWFRGEEEYNK